METDRVEGSGDRQGEGEWIQTGWRGVETDRVEGNRVETDRVKGSGDRWGEGEWRQMG